jgi:hypothetical protein
VDTEKAFTELTAAGPPRIRTGVPF